MSAFLSLYYRNKLKINYASEQNRKEETHRSPNYKQMPYCVRKFHPTPQIEYYPQWIRQSTSQNKPHTIFLLFVSIQPSVYLRGSCPWDSWQCIQSPAKQGGFSTTPTISSYHCARPASTEIWGERPFSPQWTEKHSRFYGFFHLVFLRVSRYDIDTDKEWVQWKSNSRMSQGDVHSVESEV